MRSDCGKLAGYTRLITGKEPMYPVWRLAQYLRHFYVASRVTQACMRGGYIKGL
jgi:hypothetical protein